MPSRKGRKSNPLRSGFRAMVRNARRATRKPTARRASAHLRSTLARGLVLALPVLFTLFILQFFFNVLDSFLGPALETLVGRRVPGAGVVGLLLLIYLGGLAADTFVGRKIGAGIKSFLLSIPGVRNIYSVGLQLTDAFAAKQATGFQRVVTIEYPRKDAWAIGFLAGFVDFGPDEHRVLVYIPTSPVPNSGWLGVFRPEDVHDTDLSISTAMEMVVSGGIAYPEVITTRPIEEATSGAKTGANGARTRRQANRG